MEALLIVDFQNDFLPGGALAVPFTDELAPVINELMEQFDLVIASQDWHPPRHVSFASSYHQILSSKEVWPDHCLQGSKGAEISPLLNHQKIQKIFRKGTLVEEDSYSAFFNDGAKKKSTGLNEFLSEKGVKKLFIVGLVLEYCVEATAMDAKHLGYEVVIIKEGVGSLSSVQ